MGAIQQIYHPYWLWEDYLNGMWRTETKEYENSNLQDIIIFTGNHILYGKSMIDVIENWNYSCEHNLSNNFINKKAWIGHAACCHYKKYPEYLVRKAWWILTDNQRLLADNEALRAIKQWEQNIKYKNTLEHGKKDVTQMAFQMKFL